MFILKNYNKFLQNTEYGIKWVDVYIHRFQLDYRRLVKFNSKLEAEQFIEKNPHIEEFFDAWIVEDDGSLWT